MLAVPVLLAALLQDGSADAPLRVVTKHSPPFSMQEGGEWTGLSIELWEKVAEARGWSYDYVDSGDLSSLLRSTREGEVDVAVAALTTSSEREQDLDFCLAFLHSGLGVAVRGESNSSPLRFLSAIVSIEFLGVVGALAALLFGCGALLWFFERRRNDEFPTRPAEGLWDGFWWAAVTMTTVGYGDRSPRTVGGRVVGLVWMFASIILISGFTASIASSLTVSQLQTEIGSVDDLRGKRIGSVADSTSAAWLDDEGFGYQAYPDVQSAARALADGDLEGVVYDRPMLLALANDELAGRIAVLPGKIRREDYAFAVPPDSPLREQINQALPDILNDNDWEHITERYLGR